MRRNHFLVTSALGARLALSVNYTRADDDLREAHAILGASPFAHANYGNNAVRGSAVLIPQEQGASTKVILRIRGLTPGTVHIGHIHGGNCPQLFVGTILHNLEPVVINASGEGSSRTTIPASIQGLVDCSWWVAIHQGPGNTSPQSPAVAVGPVITGGKRD